MPEFYWGWPYDLTGPLMGFVMLIGIFAWGYVFKVFAVDWAEHYSECHRPKDSSDDEG